jgi:CheY-like chemotaxis protein
LINPLTRRIGHARVLLTLPSGHGGAAAFCEQEGFLPPAVKPLRGAVLARMVGSALGRTMTETSEQLPIEIRTQKVLSVEDALAAGRLILVAEDNAVNRLVIAKQLTELGHTFEIAHDGEAAWQLLRQKPFGMVLTDCAMPVLDGYELARRIRRAEAEAGDPHLPVVALTANVSEGEIEKCRAAGFDDYLSKPVALGQLSGCIDQWLPSSEGTEDGGGEGQDLEPASNPAAVIDIAKFSQIVGSSDREVLNEVLGYFIATFHDTFATVRETLAARDRQALSIAAHTAKGAARSACAPVLANLLQEVEDLALTRESYARLGKRLDQAEKAFADVRDLIESGEY